LGDEKREGKKKLSEKEDGEGGDITIEREDDAVEGIIDEGRRGARLSGGGVLITTGGSGPRNPREAERGEGGEKKLGFPPKKQDMTCTKNPFTEEEGRRREKLKKCKKKEGYRFE